MYKSRKKTTITQEEIIEILNGVPDIIKVYNPDHTICFFNEAGYKSYNKTPDEVRGKVCYKTLERNKRCNKCAFEEVVRAKKMITQERYIPELNKVMDICYNPIFNEDGDIEFVVERLRDVTEKKILDKLLADSKERYKQAINAAPDSLFIIVDNKIVLANYEACNLLGLSYNKIIDSNIYKYFDEKYLTVLHKRFRNILTNQIIKDTHDYEFNLLDGRKINIQMICSYMTYEGQGAILVAIRDITEIKNELNNAVEFQMKNLQKDFPAKEFVKIVSVYVPAKAVSGDFYRVIKVNDHLVVGMITDVRGKGMTAALNISALDVLFLQEIGATNEPIKIIEILNKKLVNYYEENYIAACCFSMDFNKNEIKVSGAGINQFIFQKKGEIGEEKVVPGAFLGMFEDSEFSQLVIPFEAGDKIILFTDGLDFILEDDKIMEKYISTVDINKFKKYIDELLIKNRLEVGDLKDDCTMLAMEII
ncbi:MAG: PAS domain S-box protein [Clostridium butyricum]|nr:PAS domain S-box protein [Clostridium butyricum]